MAYTTTLGGATATSIVSLGTSYEELRVGNTRVEERVDEYLNILDMIVHNVKHDYLRNADVITVLNGFNVMFSVSDLLYLKDDIIRKRDLATYNALLTLAMLRKNLLAGVPYNGVPHTIDIRGHHDYHVIYDVVIGSDEII